MSSEDKCLFSKIISSEANPVNHYKRHFHLKFSLPEIPPPTLHHSYSNASVAPSHSTPPNQSINGCEFHRSLFYLPPSSVTMVLSMRFASVLIPPTSSESQDDSFGSRRVCRRVCVFVFSLTSLMSACFFVKEAV